MKIKRYKKVHKHLSFFVNNFGFRQPYQILVDGTFCFAALNNQINIADNIPRYLQGETKLLTTPCAVIEMENLGPKLHGALLILKKYAVHKCGHQTIPLTGADCLLSMLGEKNENHYIVATQDRDLQNKIRKTLAVPLLYLHSKTPVLEQPSAAALRLAKDKLIGMQESETKALDELKEKSGLVSVEEKPRKKKKRGPNPLSCKRKKKTPGERSQARTNLEGKVIVKKKRKKIRVPEHVRKELLKNKGT